jgi:hypothetical protein
LNLFNLLIAFRRKDTDPLKLSHVRLAKIGILTWISVILVWFSVPFIGVAIIEIIGEDNFAR